MMKMINNLKIFTLSNCTSCQNFKKQLIGANIIFTEVICSDNINNNKCNELEHITSCEVYPMANLNNALLCITDEYNLVGQIKTHNSIKIIYCHSIFNMFDIIKKILHLK